MPQDSYYWNVTDSDSDESLRDYRHLPPPAKQPDIDPWDLENYAYIREHLDSMELSSSDPSLPFGGDFADTNSNSFFYVPGVGRVGDRSRYDTSGDYADIDEVKHSLRGGGDGRRSYFDLDAEENPYEDGLKERSVFGIYDRAGHFRKVAVPVSYKTQFERKSSYEDYDYDSYSTKHEIYSRLDEMPFHANLTMPIYDDVRRLGRKPNNFGLTNYGHLKIDYSTSWSNLNKYIKYNN